jgi:hypothetical protein
MNLTNYTLTSPQVSEVEGQLKSGFGRGANEWLLGASPILHFILKKNSKNFLN